MRPESLFEVFLVIIIVLIAFCSSLVVEFEFIEDVFWFKVVKNCAIFATGFFGLRYWWRSRPYIKEIKESDWKKSESIKSHADIWVEIPKNEHKKGKNPIVDFIKQKHITNYSDYIIDTDKKGNIKIFLPMERFTNLDTFIIKIRA